MSTKPGVTSSPSASIVRAPAWSTLPTSVMTPLSIAMSAVRAGGPEARAGNDESFDAEAGQVSQTSRAGPRAAHDGEAVDKLRLQCRGVCGGVAQVLVAVVGTTDFRNDLAVALGQPRTR